MMDNSLKITCKSINDTEALAEKFIQYAKNGVFACLFGEIGAGKTAFVQLIAKKAGITEKVTSPSFVILNEYRTKDKIPFYHFDLYRLEHTGIASIKEELREYSKDGIYTFVEWAEFSEEQLPFDRIDIKVSYNEDDSRNYEFIQRGKKFENVIIGLKNDFT